MRDLCFADANDRDLLVLAGPTMSLDGMVRLHRWPLPAAAAEDTITAKEGCPANLEIPHQRGKDRAEGIAVRHGQIGAELLVVYDSPAEARAPKGQTFVDADLFALRLEPRTRKRCDPERRPKRADYSRNPPSSGTWRSRRMLARRARAGRARSSLLDGVRQKASSAAVCTVLAMTERCGCGRPPPAGSPWCCAARGICLLGGVRAGRPAASSGSDGTVRVVWIGQSAEELIAEAQRRLPRELTLAEERRFYGSPALCVHVLGWPEGRPPSGQPKLAQWLGFGAQPDGRPSFFPTVWISNMLPPRRLGSSCQPADSRKRSA